RRDDSQRLTNPFRLDLGATAQYLAQGELYASMAEVRRQPLTTALDDAARLQKRHQDEADAHKKHLARLKQKRAR
ncbi:MAG: hypothetical protein AAGN64_08805, partial [Bacteroidota bacterium]